MRRAGLLLFYCSPLDRSTGLETPGLHLHRAGARVPGLLDDRRGFDGTVTSITPIERSETIGTREYQSPNTSGGSTRQAWKGVELGRSTS